MCVCVSRQIDIECRNYGLNQSINPHHYKSQPYYDREASHALLLTHDPLTIGQLTRGPCMHVFIMYASMTSVYIYIYTYIYICIYI